MLDVEAAQAAGAPTSPAAERQVVSQNLQEVLRLTSFPHLSGSRLVSMDQAAALLTTDMQAMAHHIRTGRLDASVREDGTVAISIDSLRALQSQYDYWRAQRRAVAVTYLLIGVGMMILSGLALSTVQNSFETPLVQFLYCLGAGFVALALRAHHLEKQNLSGPFPDYLTSYLFIIGVNAAAIITLLYWSARQNNHPILFFGGFAAAMVLGINAHPGTWILPSWVRGR